MVAGIWTMISAGETKYKGAAIPVYGRGHTRDRVRAAVRSRRSPTKEAICDPAIVKKRARRECLGGGSRVTQTR